MEPALKAVAVAFACVFALPTFCFLPPAIVGALVAESVDVDVESRCLFVWA